MTRLQELKEEVRRKDQIIADLKEHNMILQGKVVSWKDAFERLLGRMR